MNSSTVRTLVIIVLVLAAVALLVFLGAIDISFGGNTDEGGAFGRVAAAVRT